MTIAYLVSDYSAPSHTFVRREVEALRALGLDIATFSVKHGSARDRAESLLGRPATAYLTALFWAAFTRPRRFIASWLLVIRHRPGGIKPLLWSQFHLLEAVLLARLLEQRNVSHLQTHFANSGATVGMVAAHVAGIPWSLTLHGISETDHPAGALLSEKIRRATFVACASYFMRAQAMRVVDPAHWSKMHIIRCGIDKSLLPIPSARSHTAPPHLVCVGRLSPEKGYDGLLIALRQLAMEGLEFSLTIVGGGPSSAAIQIQAASLELAERIRFTGPLPERSTLAEIAEADLLVLPSLMEGLPVVLLEALALGRPVIASHVAGIPELVSADENGWLFAPSDWDQLATSLREAIARREQWDQMGAKGIGRVEAEFLIENSARRMSELIAAVSTAE